jgi:hypothetical protein
MRKKFDEQFKAMVALEAVKEELFRQLGQMQYENEWLKKVQTAIRQRSRLIAPRSPSCQHDDSMSF